MTAPSFGERIKQLRLSTTRSTGSGQADGSPLAINALARRAQVDPAYVFHIEAGRRQHPSVPVVLRFARALGCSDLETAELLVSAGHWPWPDADEDAVTVLLAVGAALLAGDWRPVDSALDGFDKLTTESMAPAQSISNSDTMGGSERGSERWKASSSG